MQLSVLFLEGKRKKGIAAMMRASHDATADTTLA
jgi:hypothetical protein